MNNIMEVKFSAKSENESFARIIVASFASTPFTVSPAKSTSQISEEILNTNIIHIT